LLVAQMQNQDPMNPQSDTDMAAQMAQFSSLTATSASSSSLAMMQANQMVGSTVTVQLDTSGKTASGVVQGVVVQNGAPEIMVNGTLYSLSQVSQVAPTVASTSNTSSSSTSQN
jgi:flagellar basal-body rod modification protein FlgD